MPSGKAAGSARRGSSLQPKAARRTRAARLDLALSDAAFAAADLAVDGASLEQRLDWRYAAGTLSLHAGEPGALAIQSLTAPDVGSGSLRARLEPADAAAARACAGRGAAGHLARARCCRHRNPGGASRGAGAAPSAKRGRHGHAGGRGCRAEPRPTPASASRPASCGCRSTPWRSMASPPRSAFSATGLAPDQTMPISVERIRHGGEPAWFAPLALQAELVPGAEGIAFQGTLTRIGGGFAPRGARQQAAVGRGPRHGRAGAGQLRPEPAAPGPRADRGGSRERGLGRARAERRSDLGCCRHHGRPRDPGRPAGAQHAGRRASSRSTAWSGSIASGRPRRRPASSSRSACSISACRSPPAPTTFQLTDGPRLEVEQLQWRLAGGTARAEPFSLGSPREGLNVTLRAEQLDLGQLLALTRMDGLSGEGSLDGVLPLRVAQGAASHRGRQACRDAGPAVLRYRRRGGAAGAASRRRGCRSAAAGVGELSL